jgi:hypothetical protein
VGYQVHVDGAFLRLEFFDAISREELREGLAALDHREQEFVRIPDRIIDLARVTGGDGDYPTVAAVTGQRNQRVYPNPFRSAIVAPTDLAFGVARMYQTLISNPSIELEIFRSERDARAWLAR